MSTDHEDQVLGKQRPDPESKWAEAGPDIDWDPGRDWKDSGGTQIMITYAEYHYEQRIFYKSLYSLFKMREKATVQFVGILENYPFFKTLFGFPGKWLGAQSVAAGSHGAWRLGRREKVSAERGERTGCRDMAGEYQHSTTQTLSHWIPFHVLIRLGMFVCVSCSCNFQSPN